MYFQIYEDSQNKWRWRLRAGNHETIADSGQGYEDRTDCEHGISLVKQCANAPVREV